MTAMPTNRIFSGIQPTGNLTLGNYLGAIRNWVALQGDYDCLFCIVDLHAITVWQDPAELTRTTREVTAGLIAAGVDPDANTLFVQSHVPAHAQLAWVFNCVARMGWLSRMTQFKDKAGKDKEKASVGLFVYPNLMAADILAYKGTHVPVGEDQKQHLELARDIAIKFNNDFGAEVFPVPEPLILGAATRVMSLRDGSAKMSKSDPSDMSRINMTDDADLIAKKIKKAKTDPDPLPETIDGFGDRLEAKNLFNIYAALSGMTAQEAITEVGGQMFGQFKPLLADLAVSVLSPINNEMNRLLADPAYLDAVLAKGAAKADAVAKPIIDEVYSKVGFLPRA